MDKVLARVVVVDDDPSIRRALERLLRASGYAASVYASAVEFIDRIDATAPDCLVADLHMPGMTGLDLHVHLRACDIRIPTIIITANDEGNYRRRCLSAGVSDYIVKPIERGQLLRAIDAAIAGA